MPKAGRIHSEALPKKQFGTAVGNGVSLHGGSVDGRSYNARRFRELLAYYHMGYVETIPTIGQSALIRRAALLSLHLEEVEAAKASGSEINIEQYAALTEQLRTTLISAGLIIRRSPQ